MHLIELQNWGQFSGEVGEWRITALTSSSIFLPFRARANIFIWNFSKFKIWKLSVWNVAKRNEKMRICFHLHWKTWCPQAHQSSVRQGNTFRAPSSAIHKLFHFFSDLREYWDVTFVIFAKLIQNCLRTNLLLHHVVSIQIPAINW